MESPHIDDTTLSLYAAGYPGLRNDLLDYVERHLRKCPLCESRLEAEKNREVEEVSLSSTVQDAVFPKLNKASQSQSSAHEDTVSADNAAHSINEPLGSLTQILNAIDDDENARAKLWTLVYSELVCMADAHLGREPADTEFTARDLVHETYLKLFSNRPKSWQNRRYFFVAAAQAMRSILVNTARGRSRQKMKGAHDRHILDKKPSFVGTDPNDTLAVHEALTKLERVDSRKAHIVKLRYFAGMTIDEIANQLGIGTRTVDAEWSFARAWLYKELQGQSGLPAAKGRVRLQSIAPEIQRLFEHARHMRPSAQKKFLTEACGNNQELCLSVATLLEHSSE